MTNNNNNSTVRNANATTSSEENLCNLISRGDYDETMHGLSLLILFLVSLLGVLLPVLINKRNFKNIKLILEFGKFFGSGVITATGFVHVLPDAVTTLTNKCLPYFFTTSYPASAGFFAMIAALLVHFIQYIALESLTNAIDKKEGGSTGAGTGTGTGTGTASTGTASATGGESMGDSHNHGLLLMQTKRRVTTYVLEVAICIHSVIIGADLGMATDEFHTLLVALSFHQFFEGLGLGYRIFELEHDKLILSLINAVAYALTTPMGVAIGMGVYMANGSTSITNVIVAGVLDAMAGGILVYTSLVTLISDEFGSNRFKAYPLRRKVSCFVGLYLGVALMAVIGIWA